MESKVFLNDNSSQTNAYLHYPQLFLFRIDHKHSLSRDWLWNLADFNGDNKEGTIYVELYLTVHIICFSITRYDCIT